MRTLMALLGVAFALLVASGTLLYLGQRPVPKSAAPGECPAGGNVPANPFCDSGPVLTCPDRSTCPANSTCTGGGRCVCTKSFTAVSCSGASCNVTKCEYPDWWCAPPLPGTCGVRNFTVPCGDRFCPGGATCSEDKSRCLCPADSVALSCAGEHCATTKCEYPNWWCAPFTPGICGARNFTVPCGFISCPTDAVCGDNDGQCRCRPGFVAVDCDGKPCGKCAYPNWMCRPAEAK